MKIFQTQLQGLLGRLSEYEFELEDVARVVSQTIISDGQLYIYGEKEMGGIVHQALVGEDSLPSLIEASVDTSFSELDALLVFSPDQNSADAEAVVDAAVRAGAQVIGVSSGAVSAGVNSSFVYDAESGDGSGQDDRAVNSGAEQQKEAWPLRCHYHFSTGITKGLVPLDDGNRIGTPHLLVALHLYYQLYFIVKEYLEEYE